MEPLPDPAPAPRGRSARLLGLALVALVPLVAACDTTGPSPDGLDVTGLSVTSEFDHDGQAAICDTRPTEITYEVRYDGSVDTYSARFRGGDDTLPIGSFRTTGPDTGILRETYVVDPGTAPRAPVSTAEPASAEPPAITVQGETILEVVVNGFNDEREGAEVRMPIYIDC